MLEGFDTGMGEFSVFIEFSVKLLSFWRKELEVKSLGQPQLLKRGKNPSTESDTEGHWILLTNAAEISGWPPTPPVWDTLSEPCYR